MEDMDWDAAVEDNTEVEDMDWDAAVEDIQVGEAPVEQIESAHVQDTAE